MIAISSTRGVWDHYDGHHQVYRVNGVKVGRIEVLGTCCLAIARRSDGHWEKRVTNSPAAARQYVEEVAA
jgi:hypothetical protein